MHLPSAESTPSSNRAGIPNTRWRAPPVTPDSGIVGRRLTLGDSVTNSWLIEALQFSTGTGTVDIDGDVANASGTFAVLAGSTLDLDVVTIHGGTVEAASGGLVEVTTGLASTLDGSSAAVVLQGSIVVDAHLQIAGSIDNSGSIRFASGGVSPITPASRSMRLCAVAGPAAVVSRCVSEYP